MFGASAPRSLFVCAIVLCSCGSRSRSDDTNDVGEASRGGTVETGTVRRWPEAIAHLSMDVDAHPPAVAVGPPAPSGLVAFWSIASTSGEGSGFFYSDTFRAVTETRVAHVTSTRRVADIRDAGAFDYSHAVVGPIPRGEIVLVHHVPSARYLAIVLDRVEPTDPRDAGTGPYAYADVTWYLTEPGSADFSAAAP
jgi:hypothetical protein